MLERAEEVLKEIARLEGDLFDLEGREGRSDGMRLSPGGVPKLESASPFSTTGLRRSV